MPPAFRGASRLRLRSGCGTVRSLVAQLVWEVRWDGPENEFTVLLDETAIADAHASIIRREEERANRPKPRRRKRSRRILATAIRSH